MPLLLLPVLGARPDQPAEPWEPGVMPRAASSVVAVLSLARDKPEAFSDADLRVAEQIGAGVAGALHAAMRTQ